MLLVNSDSVAQVLYIWEKLCIAFPAFNNEITAQKQFSFTRKHGKGKAIPVAGPEGP
jgi:hypothetical protein